MRGKVTPYPKTHRSRRRVPLTARAPQALDALPAQLQTPLLFPAPEGGVLHLDNWRSRDWSPALEAAGVSQRGPYHLCHTFASEALAAGHHPWHLARVMGTSLREVDRTYGHLVRDSEASIVAVLEARSPLRPDVGRAEGLPDANACSTADNVRMKPSRTLDMLVVLACIAVTTGLAVVFGSHQGHSRLSNAALADRLGNEHDDFALTRVTCTTQSGKSFNGHSYNRMCDYSHQNWLCSSGTGEVSKTLYVRVHGGTFRVVERDSVGGSVPCASIA